MKRKPALAPKKLLYIFLGILAPILLLYSIRLLSERQLDDLSPGIPCSEELILKSDVLYVIPKFQNVSIAENKSWCAYILSLNKTLALHGLAHEYKEFSTDRTKEYVKEGIEIFEACFNKSPVRFKPSHLALSENNKILIEKTLRLNLDWNLNQLFHRVYHCNDSGTMKNWANDII